jgi:peptidyl-prolyl cis-trans isomerase B (cyclophilin B)
MKAGLTILLLFLVMVTPATGEETTSKNPQVIIETSMGKIVLELYPDKAPKTVGNFLAYVKSGHYNGTVFHRVIPKFMIQGGGFTPDMKQKPTGQQITNEADNGLKNNRGTIAMARTQAPHSATAQFFINTVDNDFLNHRGKDQRGWGYAVFGRVVEGMDVVDAISQVKTGTKGRFRDVPVEAVVTVKVIAKE